MTNFPWVFPVGKLAIYNKVSASDCNLDWAVKIDEHHFGKMAPPIIQMFSGKNFADKKCLCDAVEFEFREQIMVNIANLDLLAKFKLDRITKAFFIGEVFPTKHLNYWRRHLPKVMFVNLYGPIEITVACTYFIVDREFSDDDKLPVGFPCRNTEILILNDQNQLAKVDEHGEICVRGSSLALGYYNNAERTAKGFVQNPLNPHYPEWIYRTGDS